MKLLQGIDWKEFLKPDKRKVLVFLAIPVIMITGAFVIGNMDSTSSLELALGTFFGIIIFVGIFSIGIFSAIFKVLGTNPYSNEATGSVIETIDQSISFLSIIPWWYILSCTIVFIYDKLKSKK